MDKTDAINRGLVCKYCGEPTVFVDSSEIYNGISYGKIYLCRKCQAYVSCHKGTETAMGSVANAELRRLRHLAHEWFDALWQNKLKKSRYNAYSWLSLRLGMNKNYTHMGLFDEEDCKRVIEIASEYIKTHNPQLWDEIDNRIKQPRNENAQNT